jgi:hypothetical protein
MNKICFNLFIFIFLILSFQTKKNWYRIFSSLSESEYPKALKKWYKSKKKENLNLDNPITFCQKIQWLKIFDRNPLKTILADKYLVKKWVENKIGIEYIIPTIGVWDKFENIDFNLLPEKFVLKCNHGSGMNLIVKNKSKIKIEKAQKKFTKWMKTNFAFVNGLELEYKNISRKIIAEEYIENINGDVFDYKLWCFNGICDYIMVLSDRKKKLKMSFYDKNWNFLPYHYMKKHKKPFEKPKNLNKLLKLGEILSNEFKFVRVDFYILNNNTIKFGEMTFHPYSGIEHWENKKTDEIFGEKLKLNIEKNLEEL